MGTFETLAIGNRRSPFTDTLIPDSRWIAATPSSPPTRRAMRSSSRVSESEATQADHGEGACI